MNSTTSPIRQGDHYRNQLLLTVAGGAGIPAIFLNFAWNTSPFDAILDKELWQLACPFFLAVIISSASLRWVLSATLSRTERVIACLLSALSVCVTLSAYFTAMDPPSDLDEWIAFTAPIVTFTVGLYVLLKTRNNPALQSFRVIMFMQFAYLANCLLCLIALLPDWQAGAYCSLVTAIVYVAQMILTCRTDNSNDGTNFPTSR